MTNAPKKSRMVATNFLEKKLKRWILYFVFSFLLCMQSPMAHAKNVAIVLDVEGSIGPATQEYIKKGIEHATVEKAELIILRLNTPGGFMTAMQGIVKDILASPLPFVTYVAPEGSRASSAGTYILYASHIAAMAPATHLGAATPVTMDITGTDKKEEKKQSSMDKKVLNDTVAFIRGLAKLRGRNVDWAEKAVKEASSIQSDEALALNVIDIQASNIPDLLKQLNGRTVAVQNRMVVLDTQDMQIEKWEANWRLKFLSIITDPSIAYILLIIGIWGLFFEFANPGYILPGVAGVICLFVSLYAFQLLPIHFIGLGLVIAGIAFLAAEIYVTSYGVLAGGGAIAFFVGSILLFDIEGYPTPWGLILSITAASLLFFLIVIIMAIQARRRKVVSGQEALIGAKAIAQESFKEIGWVRVDGELWKAKSPVPLKKGQHVLVTKRDGLNLYVEPKK